MNQILFLFIGRVLAASDVGLDLSKTKTANDTEFATIWNNIQYQLFAFLAVMAFIGIIYSGLMMVTSGGDATKFAAGKKNLLWSIIGLTVATIAYFVIKFAYGFVQGVAG